MGDAEQDRFIDVFWVINKIIAKRVANFVSSVVETPPKINTFWSEILFFPIRLFENFQFRIVSVLRELSLLTNSEAVLTVTVINAIHMDVSITHVS